MSNDRLELAFQDAIQGIQYCKTQSYVVSAGVYAAIYTILDKVLKNKSGLLALFVGIVLITIHAAALYSFSGAVIKWRVRLWKLYGIFSNRTDHANRFWRHMQESMAISSKSTDDLAHDIAKKGDTLLFPSVLLSISLGEFLILLWDNGHYISAEVIKHKIPWCFYDLLTNLYNSMPFDINLDEALVILLWSFLSFLSYLVFSLLLKHKAKIAIEQAERSRARECAA